MRADLYRAAIDRLLAQMPELADDEALRTDMLEGELDFNRTIGRLVRQANERGAMADAIRSIGTEYQVRAERERAGERAIRKVIIELMEAAKLQSLKLPEATLSVRAPSISVEVADVNELPQGYFTEHTTRIPDKAAIKQACLAGEEIPGASIVAGEPSLTVRIK